MNSPRDRGSLPRFPGCTDRETEARGQEGSRPPDGYGYDGAARGSVRHTSLCLWMPVVISGAVCVSVCVCVCVCVWQKHFLRSQMPGAVGGGSELSRGLGFGSEVLFSLEWPENAQGSSLNPGHRRRDWGAFCTGGDCMG